MTQYQYNKPDDNLPDFNRIYTLEKVCILNTDKPAECMELSSEAILDNITVDEMADNIKDLVEQSDEPLDMIESVKRLIDNIVK